ncbi:hypothetical protein HCA61_25695 [Rhodococcus sp. HNM0563]|uniref:hypothetical protein n=1 Tax=Rhodococcus sp. HNM0563 TaxID=2716339 RepID=UPI00146D5728|nr:hypothetical protein [Rhodococcus sp. HNM0563]NLU65627.1 hypothetical protein [Rhodococcus sp. HNM0563]
MSERPPTRPRAGTSAQRQNRLASRGELLAAARIVDVSVPRMTLLRLIRLSTAHYNARNPGKRAADFASDEKFMARICVNYLRHACSAYDAHRDFISDAASPEDRAAVGAVIKGRVLRTIAEAYPTLAAEAHSQALREDSKPPRPAPRKTGRAVR